MEKFIPHPYQARMIELIQTDQSVALWAKMGLGKTVTCLTAAEDNIYNRVLGEKWLVIAPKLVAEETWPTEIEKWDHLSELRYVVVAGTPKEREAKLQQEADIYLLCRNNIPWLFDQYTSTDKRGRWKWTKDWPFQKVVLDESSAYKSAKGVWFKTLARIGRSGCQFIELTGTPSPKFLEDLWSQTYLLDRGSRLEDGVGKFRAKYMQQVGSIRTGARDIPVWGAKPGAFKDVMAKMSDITVSLETEDWLNMPDLIYNDIMVPWPKKARDLYDKFKRDWVWYPRGNDEDLLPGQWTTCDVKPVVTAGSEATVIGKLLQMCNGKVYDEDKNWHMVHDAKQKALRDLLDDQTGPVLIFYSYEHDLKSIGQVAPKAQVLKVKEQIEAWNAGEIPVMVAHPASTGHGLNLQGGGSTIIWFGLPFNLEWYLQANARIYRQGQKSESVVIHHLMMEDSIEAKVVRGLKEKDLNQQAIFDEVRYVPPGGVPCS